MLVHLCLSVLLTVISSMVILHCYLWANKWWWWWWRKWSSHVSECGCTPVSVSNMCVYCYRTKSLWRRHSALSCSDAAMKLPSEYWPSCSCIDVQVFISGANDMFLIWIIIGSDRRPETKQGIEGKIVRFRPGRIRDGVRVRYNWSPVWTRSPISAIWSYQFWRLLNSDHRSEPNTVLYNIATSIVSAF